MDGFVHLPAMATAVGMNVKQLKQTLGPRFCGQLVTLHKREYMPEYLLDAVSAHLFPPTLQSKRSAFRRVG